MKTIATGLFSLLVVALVSAQEHPQEHPTDNPTSASRIDKESIVAAIEQYVDRDANLKGGSFLVLDDQTGDVLRLKLDRVHKKRLASVGNDTYFACADFTTSKGITYDLDLFLKGASPNELAVTEIAVHKEEGKARYTWSEKMGVWTRVER